MANPIICQGHTASKTAKQGSKTQDFQRSQCYSHLGGLLLHISQMAAPRSSRPPAALSLSAPPLWKHLSPSHTILPAVVHGKWTGCSCTFLDNSGTCLTAFLYFQHFTITLGNSTVAWMALYGIWVSLFLSSPTPKSPCLSFTRNPPFAPP